MSTSSISHYWGFLFFGISWGGRYASIWHRYYIELYKVILLGEFKFVFVANNGLLKALILFMHFKNV